LPFSAPASDLLSLTTDHSSHISSVVGVGITNDDVDDIGLCSSSTGLQMALVATVDNRSDEVRVLSGRRSPDAKLVRQPEPSPLSMLPLETMLRSVTTVAMEMVSAVQQSDTESPQFVMTLTPSQLLTLAGACPVPLQVSVHDADFVTAS